MELKLLIQPAWILIISHCLSFRIHHDHFLHHAPVFFLLLLLLLSGSLAYFLSDLFDLPLTSSSHFFSPFLCTSGSLSSFQMYFQCFPWSPIRNFTPICLPVSNKMFFFFYITYNIFFYYWHICLHTVEETIACIIQYTLKETIAGIVLVTRERIFWKVN